MSNSNKENAYRENLMDKYDNRQSKILTECSQTSSNIDLTPLSNEEEITNLSFEKILHALTTPSTNNVFAKQVRKGNSQVKPSAAVNFIPQTSLESHSSCFDIAHSSSLNSTHEVCKEQKLQHTGNTSFEEMMSQILTPESGISQEQNKQSDGYVTDISHSSVEPSDKDSQDITFEELLNNLLSEDSNKDKNNTLARMNGCLPCTKTVLNINNKTQFFGLPQSHQFVENDDMNELNSDNVNDSLTPLSKRKDNTTTLKIAGKSSATTQTSFNEFSSFPCTPILTQSLATNGLNRNNVEIDSRYNFSVYTQNLDAIRSDNITSDLIHENTKNVADETVNNIHKNKPALGKNKHLLHTLSTSATISNGIQIFDVSKIGTDNWLQFALSTIKDIVVEKKNEVIVDETHNTFSMYTDDDIKLKRKCHVAGKMKIYKLNRVDRKLISRSHSPEIAFESGDNFVPSPLSPDATQGEQNLSLGIRRICNDENLICSQYNKLVVDKSKIKSKIYNIVEEFYHVFENNQIPCLVVKGGRNRGGCTFKNGRLQSGSCVRKISLKCRRLHTKFCCMLYLLGKIYMLLDNSSKLTKRELFYQTKHLINRQSQMNNAIEEVSCLLNIEQRLLNIVTHSGLVYGNLKLFWASGEVTHCNVPATVICFDMEDLVEVNSTASFILVVEKESIFHKLLEEDLPNKLTCPFIMITGRGCPNFNTRLFLNRISSLMSLPVFILVDADIYGISIMLNYRFGAFKTSYLSEHLSVPNARWLGVYPSEIPKYGIKHQKLTTREKKRINSVLTYPYMEEHPKIVEELKLLLDSDKKASIEGLIKNDTFLSESYLPIKFFNGDFI